MDPHKLSRFRKLVALCASPSTEEARTAAFLACEMIRRGEIVVGGGAPSLHGGRSAEEWANLAALAADKLTAERRESSQAIDRYTAENDRLRAELEGACSNGPKKARARKVPPPPPPEAKTAGEPRRAYRKPVMPVEMFARYDGRCCMCEGAISAGDKIIYDGRAAHLDCYRKASDTRAA